MLKEKEKYDILDYIWSGPNFFADYETDSRIVTSIMAVNEGALTNAHPALLNADLGASAFSPILDRCHDPGAGAFSDYTGYSFKSRHPLEPGEEVFVSYGDSWYVC